MKWRKSCYFHFKEEMIRAILSHTVVQQSRLEQNTEFQVHCKQIQTSGALEKNHQIINLLFCHFANHLPVLCEALGALCVLVLGNLVDCVYASTPFKDVGHGVIQLLGIKLLSLH